MECFLCKQVQIIVSWCLPKLSLELLRTVQDVLNISYSNLKGMVQTSGMYPSKLGWFRKVTLLYHHLIRKNFLINPFLSNTQMTQRCVAVLVLMLIYYNSIRRRYHLTRSGILSPNHSPWRHLHQNGDEGSYLNKIGFSRRLRYLKRNARLFVSK